MNEPPVSSPAARAPVSALCERHGLRFDPSSQSGCVLCRKERDAAAPEAVTARRSDAVGPGWLFAALLWLISGLALAALHQSLLSSFSAFASAPGAESATAEPQSDFEQDVDSGLEVLRQERADADAGRGAAADDADGDGPDDGLYEESDEPDSP